METRGRTEAPQGPRKSRYTPSSIGERWDSVHKGSRVTALQDVETPTGFSIVKKWRIQCLKGATLLASCG